MVNTYFAYTEDDQFFGSFKIPGGEGTKEDYLLIDYVNEDTTEIAGRFQVKFTKIGEALPIEVPTSLIISCGTFRCEIEK